MSKNPFEIFGLTPEMVSSLAEKDLFSVLKSMYRTLAKTVHPDVRRRKVRKNAIDPAVELNLAFEALNLDKNPVAFRRHRKNFIARRPKEVYQKSLILQKELAIQESKQEHLADAYFARLTADYGWEKEEGNEVYSEDSGRIMAHFPLRNLKLGLLDVAINQNLKMVSWSVGSNYKEIKFDDCGKMTVKPIGRSRFTRASYIHLLGTVCVNDVELVPLLERLPSRFFKAPALNASIGADGPSQSVLNRISQKQFKSHVLTNLKPEVTERSYLFSLNKPEFEETGCLTVEGLIVKIDNFPKPVKAG